MQTTLGTSEIYETEDPQEIYDFIVDADFVEGPPELYALVSKLWPYLLHKIKPPHTLMH